MARSTRVHLISVLYYVTSRGGADQPLFHDQQDYEMYLELLQEYRMRHQFKLFAYCLLPDHIHLCVEPSAETTVSAIMHDVTSRYTKYFNKRYSRSGHLFQERFKAVIVEKAPYLLPLTAYLHTHPVRTQLTKEFQHYAFSSYQAYSPEMASARIVNLASEVAEVLARLPGAQTAEAYLQYVSQMPAADIAALQAELRQLMVGSEEFVASVRAKIHGASESTPGPHPQPSRRPPRLRRQSIMTISVVLMVVVSSVSLASMQQKITLLEQTVLSLSLENEATFQAQYSSTATGTRVRSVARLDGTEWEVQWIPMGDTVALTSNQTDELRFTKNEVSSHTLMAQGFSGTNYTMTSQPNGTIVWETMQRSPAGEIVRWRGERQGTMMRGVVTRQGSGRPSQDFTFVGTLQSPRSDT